MERGHFKTICPYSKTQVASNTVTVSSTYTCDKDSESAEAEVRVKSAVTGATVTTLGVADTGAEVSLTAHSTSQRRTSTARRCA